MDKAIFKHVQWLSPNHTNTLQFTTKTDPRDGGPTISPFYHKPSQLLHNSPLMAHKRQTRQQSVLQSGKQGTKLDLLSWSVKKRSTQRTTTQPTSRRSVRSTGTNASPRHSGLMQLTNTTKEVSCPALMLLLCLLFWHSFLPQKLKLRASTFQQTLKKKPTKKTRKQKTNPKKSCNQNQEDPGQEKVHHG